MERSIETIELLADKLTNTGPLLISFEDAADALFMLWEHRKKLDWMDDLFKRKIDFDVAYRLLRELDFQEFQQQVPIDASLFAETFTSEEAVANVDCRWRINRYHHGFLHSVVHLYSVPINLRLDLRTGACIRSNEFAMRVSMEPLIEIREILGENIKEELPSLLIN